MFENSSGLSTSLRWRIGQRAMGKPMKAQSKKRAKKTPPAMKAGRFRRFQAGQESFVWSHRATGHSGRRWGWQQFATFLEFSRDRGAGSVVQWEIVQGLGDIRDQATGERAG